MLIKIKAFPGSKKEEVLKRKDFLEIKTKVKAERGEANKRILELVSKYLKSLVSLL